MTADEEARRILDDWQVTTFIGSGKAVAAYARRLEAGMRALDAEIVRLRTERNEWGEQALGMVAVEKDLNARIAAARTALDKAWRAAPDYLCGDLDEVLAALDGDQVPESGTDSREQSEQGGGA